MREKKNHLYVDSGERSILLHSLVELKNQLIQQADRCVSYYGSVVSRKMGYRENKESLII